MYLHRGGYQPQIAGPIKKADGPILIEFQLEPDRQVGGRVLTPDRKPAKGATVRIALFKRMPV